MKKFENFVRGTLFEPINQTADEILMRVEDPYRPPPDPEGEISRLVLTDSLTTPTNWEVVTYTEIVLEEGDPEGPGLFRLTNVKRGQEGTLAQSWTEALIQQDITAAGLSLLEVTDRQHFIYGVSTDTTVRKFTEDGHEVWVNDDSEEEVTCVTTDVAGNVYIGNLSGHVLKIGPDGQLAWIHTDLEGEPVKQVKVGPDGSVYVFAHEGATTSTIRKISPDGEFVWDVFPISGTSGIFLVNPMDVDEDGFIYFSEVFGGRTTKISADGDEILRGGLSSSVVFVGKDGFIYMAPVPAFGRLRKTDRNFNSIVLWNSDPDIAVSDLDSDYEGNLYGAGTLQWGANVYRLAKFTNEGDFVWGINDTHELWDELDQNHQVSYRNGKLYACANGWGDKLGIRHIRVFDAEDGTYIGDIGPFNASPFDVDVAPLDQTVVAKYGEPWALGHVKYHEVVEKPWFKHLDRFRELDNEPETPPSGMCVVWLDDDRDFKVKFDNGAVVVIASPT